MRHFVWADLIFRTVPQAQYGPKVTVLSTKRLK